MPYARPSLKLASGDYLRLATSKRLALVESDAPSLPEAPRLALHRSDSLEPARLKLASGDFLLMSSITAEASLTLGHFDNFATFPTAIAKGSRGGPGHSTEVQEMASGQQIRIPRWSRPQRQWDAAMGIRRNPETTLQLPTDIQKTLSFYRARRGSLIGFRFLDPLDWSTHHLHRGVPDVNDYRHRMVIGAGDGAAITWQLVKRYRLGHLVRIRPISRPIHPNADPVRGVHFVWLNGVLKTVGADYTISYNGGAITFSTPPTAGQVIEWAGTFHCPARFSAQLDEAFQPEMSAPAIQEIRSVPMIELKENVWFSDHKQTGGYKAITIQGAAHRVDTGDGYVQKLTPVPSGTTSVYLPRVGFFGEGNGPEFVLLDGGPHFLLVNGAAGGSGKNLRIKAHDGTTVVTTLAPAAHCVLYLRNDGTWMAGI